jgi:plasmid stabilization system protein ParE
MKLRWSERSVNDLIAIRRYISQDNPKTAKKWVAKLRQRAKRAAETGLTGRIVPEFN